AQAVRPDRLVRQRRAMDARARQDAELALEQVRQGLRILIARQAHAEYAAAILDALRADVAQPVRCQRAQAVHHRRDQALFVRPEPIDSAVENPLHAFAEPENADRVVTARLE